ncbi:MAG: acyltransferase [Oscillospiraceae bacterium]|nr:acyltransferase [Oscillospiraceae bacterium]
MSIFSDRYERSTWVNSGTIIFDGKCNLGKGVRISCSKDAKIEFGNNFVNTAKMTLVCVKSVVFGDDCLVSWNVTIMDGDTHKILSPDGQVINESKPVFIKEKVWIGCESLILKGVTIEHDCVIAANSTITKNCTNPNTVYGNLNRPLHENITWCV